MKKNGFVLIETITVLLIVIISMLGLYKGYSVLFNNLSQKKYFDNINDVYKANILKSDMTSNFSWTTLLKITTTNCSSNGFSSSCANVMNDLGIDYIILTSSLVSTDIENSTLSNSDKRYMNILENGRKYLIIHYKKNDKDYYASLSLGA